MRYRDTELSICDITILDPEFKFVAYLMRNNTSCKLYIGSRVSYDSTKFVERQNFSWDLNMLSNNKDITKYTRTQVGTLWLLG